MQSRHIVIDPRNMSPEEERILQNLLEEHPALYFVESYPMDNDQVSVLYDITPFKSNKSKRADSDDDPLDFVRFAVNLASIGSGSQGEVLTTGILSPRPEGGLRYREETNYSHSAFVLKKEKLPNDFETRKAVIEQRIKILKLATHLASKKVELLKLPDNNYVLLMIIRQFKGQVLGSIIKELCQMLPLDKSSSKTQMAFLHDDNFLFQVTIALFTAYKEQVHDAGLIHRDIKPENIIIDVDWQKNIMNEVNIVDFEIAVLQSETNNSKVGTPGYMAPELEVQGASSATDIYSLGIIAKLLWAGRKANAIEKKVQELIDQMLSDDPKARPDINKLLVSLNALKLETCFGVDSTKLLNDAYTVALQTREKLLSYARQQIINNIKADPGVLSNEILTIFILQLQSLNLVLQAVDSDSTKACLAEFAAALNIKSLPGPFASVDEIHNLLMKILTEFAHNVDHLTKETNNNQIVAHLTYVQSKLEKCYTLADIVDFNAYCQKILQGHEQQAYVKENANDKPNPLSKEEELILKRIAYHTEKVFDITQLHDYLLHLKKENYAFLKNKNFYTANSFWVNIIDEIQKKACLLAEQDMKLLIDPKREKIYMEILKENPTRSVFSFNTVNSHLQDFQNKLKEARKKVHDQQADINSSYDKK